VVSVTTATSGMAGTLVEHPVTFTGSERALYPAHVTGRSTG
jgi:hypothetical protein